MSLTREILKPDLHCLFNHKVTLSKLMSTVLTGPRCGRYLIGQGHRVISVRSDMLQVLYVLQETMSESSEDREEWGDPDQCEHQQGDDPYYKYKRLYKDKLAELEYKYDEVNVNITSDILILLQYSQDAAINKGKNMIPLWEKATKTVDGARIDLKKIVCESKTDPTENQSRTLKLELLEKKFEILSMVGMNYFIFSIRNINYDFLENKNEDYQSRDKQDGQIKLKAKPANEPNKPTIQCR